jgi:pimeloyl-ACP methyl ester carboxylesterase
MTPIVKSVALPGDLRLPYVEQGDPAGLPVLLLHGVTDSWRSFSPVLPHLPPSLRAVALTQRGHGDADRPAAGYRAQDFAADAAAAAAALGLGPALVVGHSMGASNAVRLALDHPERVRGLVLAGAFAGYRDNPVVSEFWHTTVSQLADPVHPAVAREFQEGTLAQPVPAAFLDTAVEETLKVPARVWRAAFAGFLEDESAAELGRIAAPTLLIWGARDALVPRRDQDALLRIPGSRLIVYERAGHAVHWEEPERFARDVAAFARELGSPAGALRWRPGPGP